MMDSMRIIKNSGGCLAKSTSGHLVKYIKPMYHIMFTLLPSAKDIEPPPGGDLYNNFYDIQIGFTNFDGFTGSYAKQYFWEINADGDITERWTDEFTALSAYANIKSGGRKILWNTLINKRSGGMPLTDISVIYGYQARANIYDIAPYIPITEWEMVLDFYIGRNDTPESGFGEKYFTISIPVSVELIFNGRGMDVNGNEFSGYYTLVKDIEKTITLPFPLY